VALTISMAADHAGDNVRVNCIAPGLMYTPMVAGRLSDANREHRRLAAPMQTEGTAWDIGWAAVYLASDEARWVTGVVLPVDAGLTVTTPATFQRLEHMS
jgi:NAD(P)-dependent dehydrogenase (short-subunit alcohol dehydrogenase family)